MTHNELTPDERYLFIEILDRHPEGEFTPDLTEGSAEYLLTEKLGEIGWINAQRQWGGKIYVTFLKPAGKTATQNVRGWIHDEGRAGEIQIKLYNFLKETNGQSPEKLIGHEIRGEEITEEELYEAVETLEQVGAITIPQGTSNGGVHGLPLRASHHPSWGRRMSLRKPPAWSKNNTVSTTHHVVNQSTTNNISQGSYSQVSIGDNTTQTQTNTQGLSGEDLEKIAHYFDGFRDLVSENIIDGEQQKALLTIAEQAEATLKEAESEDQAKSIITDLMKKIPEMVAEQGANVLLTYLVEGLLLMGNLSLG